MRPRKNKKLTNQESLVAYLDRAREERGGRTATSEEIAADLKAWEQSLTRLSKSELRMQKIARLEQYIELANKFPPDLRLFDIGAYLRERAPALIEGTTEFELRKFRSLLIYLDEPEIPSDFRDYILEDVTDSVMNYVRSPDSVPSDEGWKFLSRVYSTLQRYDELRETRERLRTIARMKMAKMFINPHSISVSSSLTRDEDGVLQLRLDPFAETVQGLEADRIRECPVCRNIFWANPKSKMSCSPRCRNVFNVRKHRDLMKKNKARK